MREYINSLKSMPRYALWGRIGASARLLGEAAYIMAQLRGPTSTWQRAAIGVKAADPSTQLYGLWRTDQNLISPYAFFSEWIRIDQATAALAIGQERLSGTQSALFVEHQEKGSKKADAATWATWRGHRVGWVGQPIWSASAPFYCCTPEGQKAMVNAASEKLWTIARAFKLESGKFDPIGVPSDVVDTQFLHRFTERVQGFWDKKLFWSFLIAGEPGLGKTSAGAYVARKLNANFLAVTAHTLWHASAALGNMSSPVSDSVEVKKPVDTLAYFGSPWDAIERAAPEVLLVSDIERLPDQSQSELLDVLEKMRLRSRVLILAVNDPEALDGALRRPGRVDEIIDVEGMTLDEVEQVTGRRDERFVGFPIVYGLNWRRCHETFGTDEFDRLQAQRNAVLASMEEQRKRRKRRML